MDYSNGIETTENKVFRHILQVHPLMEHPSSDHLSSDSLASLELWLWPWEPMALTVSYSTKTSIKMIKIVVETVTQYHKFVFFALSAIVSDHTP